QNGVRPFSLISRVTTADFFSMFDAPFLYGGGWSRADDEAPSAVVVLSKYANQKLFGGANSVGHELTVGGHSYRVIGVLAAWRPWPRYYDPTTGAFDVPEDIFIPFGWMRAYKLETHGWVNCNNNAKFTDFDSLLTQDCVWLQYWVEFRKAADRDRFQTFVDNYTNEER